MKIWTCKCKFEYRVQLNEYTIYQGLQSEKFKMDRNGNSILSENICDLLLV